MTTDHRSLWEAAGHLENTQGGTEGSAANTDHESGIISRTPDLAAPGYPGQQDLPRGEAGSDPRVLWWLPPLLSCLTMIPLSPLVLAAFILALIPGPDCIGPGLPCIGHILGPAGAGMETAALILLLAQWPLAYWLLRMPARVVMACVPPALTVFGGFIVL